LINSLAKLFLFSSFHTKVTIKRCGPEISLKGLQFLKWNKVRRLELHNISVKASDIHQLLNDWTLDNLHCLSLCGYAPRLMFSDDVNTSTGLSDCKYQEP